jgi:transcriptional regulator with XRE-family HTH domain
MDDQRLGAALRTVRVRRGLTQAQLAQRGGVSASLVSLVERGHCDTLSLRSLRAIAAALDIRLDVTARLRTGDVDRLLNAAHATLHEDLARLFLALPEWLSAAEVSFAIYGERGVIDILAFHAPSGSLLVIELKTELVSFEDLLTTMDVRTRLARKIAAERGWAARSVSCWVVVADTPPNRRRLGQHRALVQQAFPANGRTIRAWLREPLGAVRGLSMWSISNGSGVTRIPALVRRVRPAKSVQTAT